MKLPIARGKSGRVERSVLGVLRLWPCQISYPELSSSLNSRLDMVLEIISFGVIVEAW